jgi:transposase
VCERSEGQQRQTQGNTKTSNKYLLGVCRGGNLAVRYQPVIRRFFQRKKAKSHRVVAFKGGWRTSCAWYYIISDRVAFDLTKAFCGTKFIRLGGSLSSLWVG